MLKTKEENENLYVFVDHNINNNIEDICDLIELQYDFLSGNCKKLFLQFTDCERVDAAEEQKKEE